MKIPKKLKMFGYDWKVIRSKDINSYASYDWVKFEIKVPEHYKEEEFLHEIMEAILTHLQYRYAGIEGGMEYKFIFDHTGLCQFHKIFYQVLKDNKLI